MLPAIFFRRQYPQTLKIPKSEIRIYMKYGLKKGILIVLFLAVLAFSSMITADSSAAAWTRVYCRYAGGAGGYSCDSGQVSGDSATCSSVPTSQCAEEGYVYCYSESNCEVQGTSNAGPTTAYRVLWDSTEANCTCRVGAGRWDVGFESGTTPSCCGDDSGEYYNYFKVYPSNPAEPNGKLGGDDSSDDFCCDNEDDCVYNNQCYSDGYYDLDSDGLNDYYCYSGREWWINVDYHTNYCTNNGFYWNVGNGDADVEGDYYTTTGSRPNYCTIGLSGTPSTECCCGDDSGEYYKTYNRYTGSTTIVNRVLSTQACCSADNRCIDKDSNCIVQNNAGYLNSSQVDDWIAACGGGSYPDAWIDCDYSSGRCSYCDSIENVYWITSGETGVGEYDSNTDGGDGITECCGDDASEYYLYKQANKTALTHISWADDSGDDVCCDSASDCVFSTICYSAGTQLSGFNPGSDDDYAACTPGTFSWVDVDSSSSICTGAGLDWITAGEAGVGEYGASADGGDATTECCGDDSAEFYKDQQGSQRCCSASTDCVNSTGGCQSDGGSTVFNNIYYVCTSGSWVDSGCGTSGYCASGEYCRESDHTCQDLPLCAEANAAYGYNPQEDNEDHWGDCSPAWNSCDSLCVRRGADGFCAGGEYACDTDDSTEDIPSGSVCTGSGAVTSVSDSPGEYCNYDEDCDAGDCTATEYFTSCDGAGSCRIASDHIDSYQRSANAQTGYSLGDACETDGSSPCQADKYSDYQCSGSSCGNDAQQNLADGFCTAGTPSQCTYQGAWKGWSVIEDCDSYEKCQTDDSTYAECYNPAPDTGAATVSPDPVIRVNSEEQWARLTVSDECGYDNIREISIQLAQDTLSTNQRGRFSAFDGSSFAENTTGFGNSLVTLDGLNPSSCASSGSASGASGSYTCAFNWTLDSGYGSCGSLDNMDVFALAYDNPTTFDSSKKDDWELTDTNWDCNNQPYFGSITGVDMNLATGQGYETQTADITYTDIDGYDDLESMRILVNWNSGAPNSCDSALDPDCGGYFVAADSDLGGEWDCYAKGSWYICNHSQYGGDKAVLDVSSSSILCSGNDCTVSFRWYYPGVEASDRYNIDLNDISRLCRDDEAWESSGSWTNQDIDWNTTLNNNGASCSSGNDCTSSTCVDTDDDSVLDTCLPQGTLDGECGGGQGNPADGYNPYRCDESTGSDLGLCIYDQCQDVSDSDSGPCYNGTEYRNTCASCLDNNDCDRTTDDGAWDVSGHCQAATCCSLASPSYPYSGAACDLDSECISYCDGIYNESYYSGGSCDGTCACTYSSSGSTDTDSDNFDNECESFDSDPCSIKDDDDNCGNIFTGASNCPVAGDGVSGTDYCTNCAASIYNADSTCNCAEDSDDDASCCNGLAESQHSADTEGECDSSCGAHPSCDEQQPYSCIAGVGWCNGTQGCQQLCTDEVVGTSSGDSSVCGDATSTCFCTPSKAGFSCDEDFDSTYGICTDELNECCDDGKNASVVAGEYQCGCDSANDGYRCDFYVGDLFVQDGLCASVNDGSSYTCLTAGHACFDDGFYESSCSYCSYDLNSDPLGDNCTTVLDSGDYSPNGLCTDGGACTTSGSIYADTDDSMTLKPGCSSGDVVDICVSAVSVIWDSDGICVSGGSCDTNEVCNHSSTGILMESCASCPDGSEAMSASMNDGTGFNPDTICIGGTTCLYNLTETGNCGCTSSDAQNAERCDMRVEGSIVYDGVCAATNDAATELDCVAGDVFFDGTYYLASRKADGSTDGRKCDSLITGTGFNWEGYGLSDGTCDTQGITARDCGESGGVSCQSGDSFYDECALARSGQPDSCDTTINSGSESWSQEGTCISAGDDSADCDQAGHLADNGDGSFADDCSGNAGLQCDSSVLGGDYLADGVCYDNLSSSTGCCVNGQYASGWNNPNPEYCGTEAQACNNRGGYNCSIILSESYNPQGFYCDDDDDTCDDCSDVLGSDFTCEQNCGADAQCDEQLNNSCTPGLEFCTAGCAYQTDEDSVQQVCNCQGGHGLSDTCSDGQSDCWLVNSSESGGNCCEPSDNDYYCGASGGCDDGVYHADADTSSYVCQTCSLAEWNAAADSGSGECCGDDSQGEDWDADDYASSTQCCLNASLMDSGSNSSNYYCYDSGPGAQLYRCGGTDTTGSVDYEAADCELIAGKYCDLDNNLWLNKKPEGCGCNFGTECITGVCIEGQCDLCSLSYDGQRCSDDSSDYSVDGICTRDASAAWDCDESLAALNSSQHYGTCADARWNSSCDSGSLAGGFSADGVCGGAGFSACCTDYASGSSDRPEVCGTESEVCASYNGDYCDNVSDSVWISAAQRCDSDDSICDPCSSGVYGQDGNCEEVCGATLASDELVPGACFGTAGWTNTSCFYFTEGDDNAETCACKPDQTIGGYDLGKSWNLGGEASPSTCCGDDASEWYLESKYNSTLEGYLGLAVSDACCIYADSCVNGTSSCFAANNSHNVDGDSDLDACLDGIWYDCVNNSQCDTGAGFHCSSYECTTGCVSSSECPLSHFCNTSGICQERFADGQGCIGVTIEGTQQTDRKDSEDRACQSYYCDNDGLGIVDDGYCFSVNSTYYESIDSNCEYSINSSLMLFNADEKAPDSCFGTAGWTNASCYYFTDGDSNNETCFCLPDSTSGDLGRAWGIGGEMSPSACCGDDASEYYLDSNYSDTLDNLTLLPYADGCCAGGDSCVDQSSGCHADASEYNLDSDNDTDYCLSGQWVDCSDDSQCNLTEGYTCDPDNECRQHIPADVDVTPNSGVIYSEFRVENFTSRHADSEGYSNIDHVRLLLNTNLSMTQGDGEARGFFYGLFNRTTNTFYIRNDNDTAWLAAGQIGSVAETCNSYSCIEPGSAKAESGQVLTVFWNIRFMGTWEEDNLTIYLYSSDNQGNSAGFTDSGSVRLENDLEVESLVCDDPSPEPGDDVVFTATVKYNSSSVSVPSQWFWCGAWIDDGGNESTQNYCNIEADGQAAGCYFSVPYPDPHDSDHGFVVYCDGPDNLTADSSDNFDAYLNVECPTEDTAPFGDRVTSYTPQQYAGMDYIIEVEAKDANGWQDIDYVGLRLDWVGGGGDLPDGAAPFFRWGLPVQDQFNEIWDSGDRAYLNTFYSSYSNDGNDTVTLIFNYTPYWNFDESDDNGSLISVYSSDDAANFDDWDTDAGVDFYSENDIILNCTVDSNATYMGAVVNFSGYVNYEASSLVPLDYELSKGIVIFLRKDGTLLQKDESFNPSGYYRISHAIDDVGPVLEYLLLGYSNESGSGSGLVNHSHPACSVMMTSDLIGEFTVGMYEAGSPVNDTVNITAYGLDYLSGDTRDIGLICSLNDSTPLDRLAIYNESEGEPGSLSVFFSSQLEGQCSGGANYFYCSGYDPKYSSIVYLNESKNLSFNPDDGEAYCIACGYPGWAMDGEADPAECCGDDSSEHNLTSLYSTTIDLSLPSTDACCSLPDKCVFSDSCYNSTSYPIDIDVDGDLDYCDSGEWIDCNNNFQCDTASGYYCNPSNDCTNGCQFNWQCPSSHFCNSTGICQPRLSDGEVCVGVTMESTQYEDSKDSEDGACLSGYCDNDGVGVADDSHCFSVNSTYYDGEDDACEYSINSSYMLYDADEKAPYSCFGTSGWTNSSCYYFTDGDSNSQTCGCVDDFTPPSSLDLGKAWSIGGEVDAFTCCGDDADNYYFASRYNSTTLDNSTSLAYEDSCCDASTDCVNGSGACFASMQSSYVDFDTDSDACYLGIWYDCIYNSNCDTGFTCVDYDCLDITPPNITFVYPTPNDSQRLISNHIFVNVTVRDELGNISACMLEWDNSTGRRNYSMVKIGLENEVYCFLDMPTVDGTAYSYRVYANDSSGIMSNSSLRTNRENAVPRFTLLSEANGSTNAGNTGWLNLIVEDDDSDAVEVSFYGGTSPGPAYLLQQSFSHNYSWQTEDGFTYYWWANLTDGWEFNTTPEWNFYENQKPVTSAYIYPYPDVHSNDTLVCNNGSLSDPDSHPVSIAGYNWFINSQDTGINSKSLLPGNTSQNDYIFCQVIVNDGYENASYSSFTVLIKSDGPFFVSSSATDEAWVGEKIYFSADFTDNKGTDSRLYVCRQPNCLSCGLASQEGCLCFNSTLSSSPLQCSYTAVQSDPHINPYWVRLIDNLDKSNIMQGSDSSFLVNHGPGIESVHVVQDYFSESLVCQDINTYDIDNDTVTLEYRWYQDDLPLDYHENAYPMSLVSESSYYRCGIIPMDEHGYSGYEVASNRYAFENIAPEVTKTSSTDMANVGSDIMFEAEFLDVDSLSAALFVCRTQTCNKCTYGDHSECYCYDLAFGSGVLSCNYTAVEQDPTGPNSYWVMVYDGNLNSQVAKGSDSFIVNHAPSVGFINISPSYPLAWDRLDCGYSVLEKDSDSYSLNFKWYEDGFIIPGINSSYLESSNITEDSSYKCSLYAVDTYGFMGNTLESSEVTATSNIVESVYATDEANVTENVTFNAAYSNLDGDNLTLYICQDAACASCSASDSSGCWCSTQAPSPSPLSCSFTPLQDEPQEHGPHSYWARVYDGTAYSPIIKGNDSSFLVNHYPVIYGLEIGPFEPGINDDLYCSFDYYLDADSDNVIVEYEWHLNSVPQGINSSVLLSGNTTKEDSWSCSVSIMDEHFLNGTTADSSAVEVLNRPMLTSQPYLNTTYQPLNRSVRCISGTYYDEDAEPKLYDSWRWYRNGQFVAGETSEVLYLSRYLFAKGDTLTCSQKVTNSVSLQNSSWYDSSNSLLVANTPPEPPGLIHPANGNATLFYRNVSFLWSEPEDLDNIMGTETFTYSIEIALQSCSDPLGCTVYFKSNSLISSNSYVSDEQLNVDSNYTWRIRANDGSNMSDWSDPWWFVVESTPALALYNTTLDFGKLSVGFHRNTTMPGLPWPILAVNLGNVKLDLLFSLNRSMWSEAAIPSEYFTCMAGVFPHEPDSFNTSGSSLSWLQPYSVPEKIVDRLGYTDSSDSAEIEIGIKVPPNEPKGSKNTTAYVSAQVST